MSKKAKNSTSECYIGSYIGGRNENQDSAGAVEAAIGRIIVVCDGMGAHNGGSTASQIAVKTIIDDIANAESTDSVPDVLRSAVIHANNAIMDAAEEDSSLIGMGTTVTALVINDDCAYATYLGDSRVYQLRGRNKVFRSFDHSMVFQSVKMGFITEEQARLSSQSNIITKALGISRNIEVEIYELPYMAGDRFILCTDGFWGAMPEKEFISKIYKGKVATALEKMSLQIDLIGIRQGGHHDNFTAAMMDVKKESKKKAKMSLKIKILILSLILALAASLSLNVYMMTRAADETLKTPDSRPAAESVQTETKTEEQKEEKPGDIEGEDTTPEETGSEEQK